MPARTTFADRTQMHLPCNGSNQSSRNNIEYSMLSQKENDDISSPICYETSNR